MAAFVEKAGVGGQNRRFCACGQYLCSFLCLMSVAVLAVPPRVSVSRGVPAERVSENLKRVSGTADLLAQTMDRLDNSVRTYYRNSVIADIAASAELGSEIKVHLLYRAVTMGDGQKKEYLEEVSAHPFPKFLVEPGTNYVRETVVVKGNGRYLSLGMPKYAHYEEFEDLRPGEVVIRGPRSQLELSWRRRDWNAYSLKLGRWKAVNRKRLKDPKLGLLTTPIQVRSLESTSMQLFSCPSPDERGDLQRRVEKQRTKLRQLEEQIGQLRYEVTDDPALRKYVQSLDSRVIELEVSMEALECMGEPGTLKSKHAEFLDNLRPITLVVKAQAAESTKRLETAKTAAWKYMKEVVRLACEDPDKLAELEKRGEFVGVQLTDFDIIIFFSDDITTRNDLIGLITGEAYPKLSRAQEEVISDMIDVMGMTRRPVTVSWVIERGRQYRLEHPTLGERVARAFDAFVTSFGELLLSIPTEDGPVGKRPSPRACNTYQDNESRGIRSTGGRTINLQRPDFDQGPGSVLGRY